MSFLFGRAATPRITAPKPPPTTKQVSEEERKKMRKGLARRTTLLTTPLGLTTPAGTQRKTLLGE
ncbi:MAG: hypothetical protein KAV87_43265 [Desulfobacteraceae bacterium]|nr:hypothetical protein [Desulfobacteraceae bacterium]